MTGRSSTGQWVVVSGPNVIGPFDGRSPATEFVRRMRRIAPQVRAEPRRLHSEADARRWAGIITGGGHPVGPPFTGPNGQRRDPLDRAFDAGTPSYTPEIGRAHV